METDDAQQNKRRKTDNDVIIIEEENAVPKENELTEDSDSYLQDFLSKKPQNKLTLFQRVVKDEEYEANERDPAEDLKLYRDATADFSDCVTDIAELKASKPDGWKDRVNEIRKEAAFTMLIMKKLNRVEKTRTKLSREKLSKEKQKVDSARIQLDNMLTEIQHLRREIDKCLKFRSKPLGIDLVPVKEFYEKAPSTISKPEITQSDEHQLQLSRLEWELQQRKELSALLTGLEGKRAAVREQIDHREKDLSSIGPLVSDVLSVSLPLKEKLGSTLGSGVPDHAYLLPDPLYFFFVQASAFRDVADKDISLEIKGNFLEAQKYKCWTSENAPQGEKSDSSKDGALKKKPESEKALLLTRHPLSVHLKFSIKDGFQIDLQFSYYLNLNLATVKPSVTTPPGLKAPSISEYFLNPNNLFHNLFSGDSGSESPNLRNYYQMQKVGLESLPFEEMGLPYIWVQKVVGLDFVSQGERCSPSQEVCRSTLPVVVRELRRRSLHRLSLLSLTAQLERDDFVLPSSLKHVKPVSKVSRLRGLSWTEYCDHPQSERFRQSPCVGPNDLFLEIILARDDAKLSCLVAVKPDYPLSPSVFSFKIDYKPLNIGNQASKYSLDIEEEVNVFWKDLLTSRSQAVFSLSFQLLKAVFCFEILLESQFPQNFPASSKNLDATFRGRIRSLPFQLLPEEDFFVHRKPGETIQSNCTSPTTTS